MRHSDRKKGTAAEADRAMGRHRPAEVISLDEWRLKHRPQPKPRRRQVGLRAPHRGARAPRVPLEFWLILLILVSAFGGAMFVLISFGKIP